MSNKTSLKKVLIINDNHVLLDEIIQNISNKESFDIRAFLSTKNLKEVIPNYFIPHYVIIDFKLDNESGLDCVQYLRDNCPNIFIIIISSSINSMDSYIIQNYYPELYFNLSLGDLNYFLPCLKLIMQQDSRGLEEKLY